MKTQRKSAPRCVQNRRMNYISRGNNVEQNAFAKQLLFRNTFSLARSFQTVMLRNAMWVGWATLWELLATPQKSTSVEKFQKVYSNNTDLDSRVKNQITVTVHALCFIYFSIVIKFVKSCGSRILLGPISQAKNGQCSEATEESHLYLGPWRPRVFTTSTYAFFHILVFLISFI